MGPGTTLEKTLMAKLLVVTSRLPYPPREGHQLRSWNLLKALAERHEVTLLSFLRRDDDLAVAGPLRSLLQGRLETFPIPSEHSRLSLLIALAKSLLTATPFTTAKYATSALRRRLQNLAGDFDLVHFDMLPLMAHADCLPAGVPAVLNAHNVEYQLLDKRAELETRLPHRLFLAGQRTKLHGFERKACRQASAVLACSSNDAEELQKLAPGKAIVVIPNGVDLAANQPGPVPAGSAQLVFVGQMGWFPNKDGVQWFLREIFPRILSVRPDAEFVLVGKSDGLEVPEDVAPRVRIAGFVPDLRPHVHAAAVYVVPLRAGSGTRLKVLEAMALGKAIVTTHVGSEGIELVDGKSAVYADDADSFAQATLALLDSPGKVAQLGTAARELAEARYGWQAIGAQLNDFYDRLLVQTADVDHGPVGIKQPVA